MDFRLYLEPQQGATYENILQVARIAEDAGYEALFRSDHYLAMGGASGEPGPTDAWTTLAGLARETKRIRLGTLMSSATFRLPGPLAISVAQVDQMSGGRIELGIGAGWFEAEHAAYGIPFPSVGERFDRLIEQVEIITGLWGAPADEPYSFRGAYYSITDSPALPKPFQSPCPPLIVGGLGAKKTPELAARFADEFNIPPSSLDAATRQFARLESACEASARDPRTLVRSAAMMVAVGRDQAEVTRRVEPLQRTVEDMKENALAGTPSEIVDRLGTWQNETGISRVYLQLIDLTDFEQINLIASEVMPQLRN